MGSSYTETCATGPTSAAAVTPVAVDSGAFDTLKQMYPQDLAQPDDNCHLTTGISGKPDPLGSVAPFVEAAKLLQCLGRRG